MTLVSGKLLLCMAGSALVSGTAVHVLEKPHRPSATRKAPARHAVAAIPSPCEFALPPPDLSAFGSGLMPPLDLTGLNIQAPAAAPAGASLPSQDVPEPASTDLLSFGVLGLALLRWRRKRVDA